MSSPKPSLEQQMNRLSIENVVASSDNGAITPPPRPLEGFGFLDLPKRPIFTIFSHLSFYDQLSLGTTNLRMRSLLLKAFRRRNSLTIVMGNDDPLKFVWKMEYKLADKILDEAQVRARVLASNVVYLRKNLEEFETVIWLFVIFPAVTELTLILKSISDADVRQLVILLDRMAPSLVTLKLFTNCGHKDFLATLNSMSALKHLSIYGDDSLKSVLMDQNATTHLPILRQLESFDLLYNDEPINLQATLQAYALPNRNLAARIACTNQISPEFTSRQLDPRLARYFKRCKTTISARIPEVFYDSLTNLTSLNLTIYPWWGNSFPTYRQLLDVLEPLTKLIFIGITLENGSQHSNPDGDSSDGSYWKSDSDSDDSVYVDYKAAIIRFFCRDIAIDVNQFAVLPSVQMLQLHINSPPHIPLREALKLEHCFPNLQSISIAVNGCSDCNSENSESSDDDSSDSTDSTDSSRDSLDTYLLIASMSRECFFVWSDAVEQLQVPKKRFSPFFNLQVG